MAGLALGNGLAARHGTRVTRPIRLYAQIEIAIAATGLAVVWVLPMLGEWLAPLLKGLLERPWLLSSVRLGAAFLLLLVPCAAMGATLPLLVRALRPDLSRFGEALGRLYGWNTLGAVAGALAGEAWLISALGVRGTAAAAAGLNLLCGGWAFWLARRPEQVAATPAAETALPAPARLLAAAAGGWRSPAGPGGRLVPLSQPVLARRALVLHPDAGHRAPGHRPGRPDRVPLDPPRRRSRALPGTARASRLRRHRALVRRLSAHAARPQLELAQRGLAGAVPDAARLRRVGRALHAPRRSGPADRWAGMCGRRAS